MTTQCHTTDWIKERIQPGEISRYKSGADDFIDDCHLQALLQTVATPDAGRVRLPPTGRLGPSPPYCPGFCWSAHQRCQAWMTRVRSVASAPGS